MPEQEKLALDSILVCNPVALALRDLFDSRRQDINAWLQKANYKRLDGSSKPLELTRIYIGVNPDRRKIQNFPAISIFVTGRTPEWWHWRGTKDDIAVRIFCCIQNTENEIGELLMYDFTELCMSILFSAPTLAFYMEQHDDNLEPSQFLQRFGTSLPRITFGSLDDDYIRAGQIDYVGEVILNHQNMVF